MSVSTAVKSKTAQKTSAPAVSPEPSAAQPQPSVRTTVDVLADAERQAEEARKRLLAQKRGAYERGLLALVRERPMADAELAGFHDAALALGIGRQAMEGDLNRFRTWLGSVPKVESPEREAELQAVVDALDAERKRLEARLPELRQERAAAYKKVRIAESARHEAAGDGLRRDFPTIDVEPVLVEIRGELQAAGKPTAGLDVVLRDIRANRRAGGK